MRNVHPKVSIVLPTYNGAKYLRRSVESCLHQTCRDIELIIVDDCSTDETPDIIRSFHDPRILYLRNENNQRLPRSLNIGFARARGEYLTWTSDDNIYVPSAIEKMVCHLQANNGEFVYTDIFSLPDNDMSSVKHELLPDSDELSKHNCIRACFLYTRKVYDKVGAYDPDMELIEDYDYWVRISQHFQLYHLREPLYYYRYHQQQLYTARNREVKIIEYLFKVKYDFMPVDNINWYIRDLVVRNSGNHGFFPKVFSRIFYRPRIQRILDQYKTGVLGFREARINIYKLIYGRESSKHAHKDAAS